MMKSRTIWIRMAVVLCAMLVLIYAIFWCKSAIGGELEGQVGENLHDVAAQNVLALESEIQDKQNLLNGIAEELKAYTQGKPEEILEVLEPLTDIYHFKRIGFVYPDGEAYTTDGYQRNLAFREFFQQSMEGKKFITGVMLDAIGTQEDINVFSVPVYGKDNKTVEGVLFATYRTRMFQELMNVDSFGGEGYSYIVGYNGTIIAEASKSLLPEDASNFFSAMLKADRESNTDVTVKMTGEMKEGKSGNASFMLKDKTYIYYMPLIHKFDGKKCYMLTIVPSQVLDVRLQSVLYYVNILLITIVCVLGISCILYVYSYQKGKRNLMRLAYEDPLTGGENYPCFETCLESRKDLRGFLVSMDLNEFKIVNNTCGVEKGDETLKNIWFILQRILRQNELAAHINADHFVLFLLEENKEGVEKRLHQITDLVSELSENLNIPRLSPYFGLYPTSGQESAEVGYSRANEAKHLVKGRHDTNFAFYDEVDFQKIMSDKELEDRFEDAIANREFEVWYQPKYSTDNATIVGAEALTRWRDKDGSLIPPYKFIPLFEKNGMISILDEYVFRTVCQQQKKWEREGKPMLPVSINISRASLYYSNVVEKYKTILDEYKVEAKYVPLEITESATIDNMEIRGLIDEFHTAGFPLLLDDFGNGYSSLATLNVMHFDILKLDKSLIDYIGDEKGEKLLYYTIKLAKSLGMKITAEGVEYVEQVTFLQRLKCNDIQGYYFSKPLPLEEYQEKLVAVI